jgi:hypothetical protein
VGAIWRSIGIGLRCLVAAYVAFVVGRYFEEDLPNAAVRWTLEALLAGLLISVAVGRLPLRSRRRTRPKAPASSQGRASNAPVATNGTPELVQFDDLGPDSFARHPVWVSCHVIDYDEPWYDDTNEETFRPWDGALPVDPAVTMYLVSATLRFADGTPYRGFVTPITSENDGERALGFLQPYLFLPNATPASFWPSEGAGATRERERFLAATGKTSNDVFPIRFQADPGLAGGIAGGRIPG